MEDRGPQVVAVAILFLILTWVTVGLRCYVRVFIVKGFGLDDKLMLVTTLFFTAYLACQLGGAAWGTGQRREHLTDANAEVALRYWFFCEVFYTISTCFLKIAVGFFLLRITVHWIHIWVIRTIMIVAVVLGVGYTSLVIFQCKPVSYWWDLNTDHHGKCLDASLVMIFTYVVSALNSVADWTFGILPILIVKDLQMKTHMKMVVSGVIGLAAIGSTATIIRLPYTSTLKPYKGDFLYRTTDFAIWTTVEVGIGISAGSIACLKPLLRSSILSSYGPSGGLQYSGQPFSKGTGSKLGGRATPLNDLRSTAVNQKSTTTTTVTGGRLSSDSDEQKFIDSHGNRIDPERWDMRINKSVTTTVVAEHTERTPKVPSATTEEGGDSTSSLGEEDRWPPLPVRAHERF